MTRTRLALALARSPWPCRSPRHRRRAATSTRSTAASPSRPARRYGDLETVNGSIHIGASARVDDAETVNGSIERRRQHPAPAALETVNGGIRVGEQRDHRGGVETVNGGIFVDRGGNIGGDVETVNGAIGLVDTDVGGGIETVNGDVTVGVGSHVQRRHPLREAEQSRFSVRQAAIRRVIVIGPNAVVDGPLVFEREVVLYVHTTRQDRRDHRRDGRALRHADAAAGQ